VEVEVEDSST
jgi:hypothetical protein